MGERVADFSSVCGADRSFDPGNRDSEKIVVTILAVAERFFFKSEASQI